MAEREQKRKTLQIDLRCWKTKPGHGCRLGQNTEKNRFEGYEVRLEDGAGLRDSSGRCSGAQQ